MRLLRVPLVALAALLSMVALAQNPPPPAGKDPASQFAALQQEFFAALSEYYKPYEAAKTDEEREKIKLDPAKDPTPGFHKKFVDFAKKHDKDPIAFNAWMMAKQTGNPKQSEEILNQMVTKYIKSPQIVQIASGMSYEFFELPSEQRLPKIMGILDKIAAGNSDESVQAAVLYSKAGVYKEGPSADPAKARQFMDTLIQKYPDSQHAKRAKGDIFELENLVEGKPAPDFEATDQDGKTFKLSDYRGKVVVLDFWGFW